MRQVIAVKSEKNSELRDHIMVEAKRSDILKDRVTKLQGQLDKCLGIYRVLKERVKERQMRLKKSEEMYQANSLKHGWCEGDIVKSYNMADKIKKLCLDLEEDEEQDKEKKEEREGDGGLEEEEGKVDELSFFDIKNGFMAALGLVACDLDLDIGQELLELGISSPIKYGEVMEVCGEKMKEGEEEKCDGHGNHEEKEQGMVDNEEEVVEHTSQKLGQTSVIEGLKQPVVERTSQKLGQTSVIEGAEQPVVERTSQKLGQSRGEQSVVEQTSQKLGQTSTVAEVRNQCWQCGKVLKTGKQLKDHIRYHHRDPTTCNLCPKMFPSKEKADRHIREVHQKCGAPHLCPDCGKQFPRLANLLRHQKSCHMESETIVLHSTATAQVPSSHECVICDKKFTEKWHLRHHLKVNHQVVLRSRNNIFLQNVQRKLKKKKTWTCLACQKTFNRGYNIARHYKEVHKVLHMAGELVLCNCDICEQKFSSNKELVAHRKLEHPQQAYGCYICDKTFSNTGTLYMHKYFEHTSKEFSCSCGKKFKRKASLKTHKEKKYCGKEERKLKSMDQCGPKHRANRLQKIFKTFENTIKNFSDHEQKLEFLKLVRKNPDTMDFCRMKFKDKFTEEDIIELVRDVNLSDRQCMRILAKMRQKWGRELITGNITKVLIDTKRKLSHLFTCTQLHKYGPLHFQVGVGGYYKLAF